MERSSGSIGQAPFDRLYVIQYRKNHVEFFSFRANARAKAESGVYASQGYCEKYITAY